MSIKIEVIESVHTPRKIQTKGGKQLTVFEQKAYAHLKDEPFPKEIRLSLWADRDTGEEPKPYEKGTYTLCPSSFNVGRYADLTCRPILKALKTA